MNPRLRTLPRLLSITAGGVLLWSGGASAVGAEELRPTRQHQETLYSILVRLDVVHYRDIELDDGFSQKLFDGYLETLDPGRWFFTADDVQGFEHLEDQLDDVVQEAELDGVFSMFERFQERRVSRYELLTKLLEDEFDSLDFTVEESLEFDREDAQWSVDAAELDLLWRRRFKNDVLNLRLADQDSEKIKETLARRYREQLKRVNQINSDDVFRVFSNALTAVYGPHTEYYPPLQAENFDIQMSLSFEGIGALLGNDGEYVKIERIIPGGPAEADGTLQPGDKITGVGQGTEGEVVEVVGWRTDECVKLIRGEKGTTVRLVILPANQSDTGATMVVPIVRDRVKLEEQEAQKEVVEIGAGDSKLRVGVIELPAFYMDFDAARRGDPEFKSSTRDVARLIAELKEEEVDGLLVDLRGNSGGSLSEAHDLAGLFLGRTPVVQVRDSSGDVEVLAAESRKIWDGPLAVLVNRLSASASEIFAAVVQDTGRGVVIGGQTFGKGTVQNLLPMKRGQLKVTLAKFYRLSGGSTQHRGVVPDVEFPALYDADQVGESALEEALPWDRVESVDHEHSQGVQDMRGALQARSIERISEDPEFVYLSERLSYSRAARLRTVLPLVESARRDQREQDDQQQLEIENRRRTALGKEQVESWDDLRELEEESAAVDPYVREAAQVLVDSIRLRT